MHMHIGLAEFLVFLAYYVIVRFLVRQLQVRNVDNSFGKALAFLD